MSTKDAYDQKYSPQTVPCRSLQDEKYTLVTDSQDIAAWLETIGFPADWRSDITGLFVEVLDGDYGEVWLTEYAAPYDLRAQYSNLDYYLA